MDVLQHNSVVLSRSISNGLPKVAYQLAQQIEQATAHHLLTADFWFQYALAAQLTGVDYIRMVEMARVSKGYTSVMHGDLLRDLILHLIRLRATKRSDLVASVQRVLDQIAQLHRFDDRRMAVLTMVRGRMAYIDGHYSDALTQHAEVDRLFADCDPDGQWRMNNSFHWYKAAVMANNRGAAHKLSYRVIRDPNASRQQTVRIVDMLGRLGLRLRDEFEYRMLKRRTSTMNFERELKYLEQP